MKPSLISEMKSQWKSAIEQGDIKQSYAEGKAGLSSFWGDSNSFKNASIEVMGRQGRLAFVRLTPANQTENPKISFDLKLREREGYWQVIELSNVKELLTKMTDDALSSRTVEACINYNGQSNWKSHRIYG